MPNYDFKSLSSFDFEQLVRDLLQEELNVTLESFTSGRDKGIDLRYSLSADKEIIVQCKHYANTSYSTLYSHLKNKEVPKVQKLNPVRYIFSCSVGLTPGNKDEILALFESYCQSTGDIYGLDDLNNLLGKFSNIEKKHYKLWLTSSAVLEKIIHNKILVQTEVEIEYIANKLKYYVQNESFFDAKEILEKSHYCVITGIPGIGKTTLAEILLIDYLDKGYEIFKISNDVREAYEVLKASKAQVFYYDDFLGQTTFGEKLNKNEEQNLIRIIDHVQRSPNKRFILTTREYILNQAKAVYEKLALSNLEILKCVIELENYTKYNRAQILYNHFYFSDIPNSYKRLLLLDDNYMKIIHHPNYNPRIIEWMAKIHKTYQVEQEKYISTFIENLDNPEMIWKHAFNYQLSEASRFLLIVMVSLSRFVYLGDLEKAFFSYCDEKANRYSESLTFSDFRNALSELEGNFISIYKQEHLRVIEFHNPSIRDFLENYISSNIFEGLTICKSAKYFNQYIQLWNSVLKGKNTSEIHKTYLVDICDEFYEGLVSNLENDCNVYHLRYKGHDSFSKFPIPFEQKLRFLLRSSKILIPQKIDEVLSLVVDLILNHINHGNVDSQLLTDFVCDIPNTEVKKTKQLKDFIFTIKDYLIEFTYDVEEYKNLSKFMRYYPEYFDEYELDQITETFYTRYNEEVHKMLADENEDPYYIRDFAQELDEIAKKYDIDVDYEVLALLDHADELEESAPLDEVNDQQITSMSRKDDDSLEKINSLFQTLLDD